MTALDLPLSAASPSAIEALNAILTAYDTTGLRHNLAVYPARIKTQRNAVAQARQAAQDAEAARALIEAEMVLEISITTDEKGKLAYSNAEARAAALTLMKGNAQPGYHSGHYTDAVTVLRNAEAALTEAQDTLTMLLDEYQSARIAARLIAAEMSVLSELIDVGEWEEVSAKGAVQAEIPEAFAAPASGRVVQAQPPKSKEVF